ncbi:hypothetical protein Agub_g3534 [Astrephomene gubernaculifera]|uniref:phytol kinase n=1 Tax=Astrephomene gubernaculifera TaxID=47775 RepID=A0AAD3HJ55_9CHLO|nr:hypothetical protein Agub_g3534 [Astrephomene gubernaculifera]
MSSPRHRARTDAARGPAHRLQAIAAKLLTDPCKQQISSDLLLDAADAAMQLITNQMVVYLATMPEAVCRTPEWLALLQLLWVPRGSRAALLLLYRTCLRALADPNASTVPAKQESMVTLIINLGATLRVLFLVPHEATGVPEDVQNAAFATASLALRLDILPACGALLAAARSGTVSTLPDTAAQATHDTLMCFPSALSLIREPRCGRRVQLLAKDILQRLTRNGLWEFLISELLGIAKTRSQRCLSFQTSSSSGPGSGASGSSSNVKKRNRSSKRSNPGLRPGRMSVALSLEATLSVILSNFIASLLLRLDAEEDVEEEQRRLQLETTSSCKRQAGRKSVSAADNTTLFPASFLRSSLRTLLSGRCMQYALAAHAVAQLAAADGGTTYGLTEEQILPPLLIGSSDDSTAAIEPQDLLRTHAVQLQVQSRTRSDGGRILSAMGLMSVAHFWGWCLLQSPPVPLVLYGRAAVQELCLRMVRLATRSAAEHAALRRRHGRGAAAAASRQGGGGCCAGSNAGGGGGGGRDAAQQQEQQQHQSLSLLLQEDMCSAVSLHALRCANLIMRPKRFPSDEGRGSDAAASAAMSEWWGAVVPAFNMLLKQAEEGIGAIRLPVSEDAGLLLSLDLGNTQGVELPPTPPPDLAAAIAAGLIPMLERFYRVHVRAAAVCKSTTSLLIWRLTGRLLSYGKPHEATALITTISKMLRVLSGGVGPSDTAQAPPRDGAFWGNLGRMLYDASEWLCTCPTLRRLVDSLGEEVLLERGGRDGSNGGGEGEDSALTPALQVVGLLSRALREWLPAAARVAVCKEPFRSSSSRSWDAATEAAAREQLTWLRCGVVVMLPALVHAAVPEGTTVEVASMAARWRQLLLQDMQVMRLLGVTVRQLLTTPEDAATDDVYKTVQARLLQDACEALECLVLAFPNEVAAALRDETLPSELIDGQKLMSCRTRGVAGVPLDLGLRLRLTQRLHMVLAVSGPLKGRCTDGVSDVIYPNGLPSSSMGALLAEVESREGFRRLLGPLSYSGCGNPACVNVSGGSEGELPRRACGRCGAVSYCGPECQRAHWRAGHKDVCKERAGRQGE